MTRFSKWFKELILPAGLLSALIIGAGIFALPYVFSRAGFSVGLFYLVVFTVAVTAIHLMYLEIMRTTPGNHRFSGFSRIYLGENSFRLSILTTVLGLFLVLTVYLILSASFAGVLLACLENCTPGSFSPILFWVAASIPILVSIKRQSMFDFLVTTAMLAIILIIFLSGIKTFDYQAVNKFSLQDLFLPYGAVLFALYGRSGISSLRDYFSANKLNEINLKKAVILGTALPAFVYALFVVGVLGLSSQVSPDTISGLTNTPKILYSLIGLLGIFSLWTSYVFLGLELKGILNLDLKLSKFWTSLLVLFLPLVIYAIVSDKLIGLISFSGGVLLALESIMVIWMYRKIKKGDGWAIPFALVFLVGLLYQIWKLF